MRTIIYNKIGSWTDEQLVSLLDRNGGYGAYKEEKGLGKSLRNWKHRDGTTAQFKLSTMTLTHPMLDRHREKLRAQAKAASKQLPKF